VRLAALARAFDAEYTRYADDLVFSGDFAPDRLVALVTAIARAEGFAVRPDKTRVMRRSARQRVTGVVVNERPNLPRDAYDRLKATLTNCVRHGPADQNRDAVPDWRAHLLGRVAWAEHVNAARGARLRALFDRIRWD
jgi:hypothetical protein